jgi:hypothetical protein
MSEIIRTLNHDELIDFIPTFEYHDKSPFSSRTFPKNEKAMTFWPGPRSVAFGLQSDSRLKNFREKRKIKFSTSPRFEQSFKWFLAETSADKFFQIKIVIEKVRTKMMTQRNCFLGLNDLRMNTLFHFIIIFKNLFLLLVKFVFILNRKKEKQTFVYVWIVKKQMKLPI